MASPPKLAARAHAEIDDVTLRLAQAGDPSAWRRLVVCYQPLIHALVWRMCGAGRRAQVDDLVQDTHIRVLRALPGFDPRGAARLSTWIITIATRVVLNDARRVRPEAGSDALSAPAGGPPDVLARARLGAVIAAAVAALPDDQRATLVLREYFDLDLSTIAASLEVEVGTVKSRLSRARAALRERLTREGVAP